MNESFDMIKRRHFLETVIKSIVIALSLGAFVYGGMELCFKLFIIKFDPLLHILISLGAALLCGATCFLLLHRSPLALARSLDEEFGLGEKIQTMVRFKEAEGDMLELQRENADAVLRGTKTKKPFIVRFFAAIISLALAVCMLLPALLVPRRVAAAPPPAPFVFTAEHEFAMNMLIEDMNGREGFNTEVRNATVQELRSLIAMLKQTHTKNDMYARVISSIIKIDGLVEEISTYKKVCVALDKSENADLKLMARSVLKLQGYDFIDDLNEIREGYRKDLTDPKSGELIATLEDRLTSLKTALVAATDTLVGFEKEALTAALGAFALEIEAALNEKNANTKDSLITRAFNNLGRDGGAELTAQWHAKDARGDVISRLVTLFEIPKSMIPPLLGDALPTLSGSESEEETGDSDESGASGGYGEGNELFGSAELIYDPFSEDGAKYVLYGEAYDDYYKTIEAIMLDGAVSAEAKEILRDYFRKLSDGTKKN